MSRNVLPLDSIDDHDNHLSFYGDSIGEAGSSQSSLDNATGDRAVWWVAGLPGVSDKHCGNTGDSVSCVCSDRCVC